MRATTGAGGSFTIGNVSAGTHTVRAVAVGFNTTTVIVTVLAGGTATANIALTPVSAALPPAVAPFDTDLNGRIDRPEAVAAVVQFFTGVPAPIPRSTAVAVVLAFFSPPV